MMEEDLTSLRAENEHLNGEVESLRSQLDEAKQNASVSAECGLKLMELNQELEQRLEQTTSEFTEQIQELKQENYVLQTQLTAVNKTTKSFQDEFDSMKEHLENKHRLETERTEQLHNQKIQEMTCSVNHLEAELEQAQKQTQGHLEMMKKLESTIALMKEQALCYRDTTDLETEVTDLHSVCMHLQEERDGLRFEVTEKENEVEMMKVELAMLKERLESMEEEVTDRTRQSNEWYRNMQELQEENIELKGRMEQMRVELLDQEWTSQGNSLFGEVEDKRQAAERKLISLQVKYDSLEKSHNTMKQQQRKMKAEMYVLLSRHTRVSADMAHMQRLQSTLQQKESELQLLNNKMAKMKRETTPAMPNGHAQRYAEAFIPFGDNKEYIEFLKQQLHQKEESISKLKDEMSLKETQLLWESNKVMETEAKLYRVEKEKAKMIDSVCRLNVKLTETQDREKEVREKLKKLEEEAKTKEAEGKDGRRRRSVHPTALQSNTGDGHQRSSEEKMANKDRPQKAVTARKPINLLDVVDRLYNVKTLGPVIDPEQDKVGIEEEKKVDVHMVEGKDATKENETASENQNEIATEKKVVVSSLKEEEENSGSTCNSQNVTITEDTDCKADSSQNVPPVSTLHASGVCKPKKVIHVKANEPTNQCKQQ